MKIYFLRHAERGSGIEQDTLTKKGEKQAENIVFYLKNLGIDKIICGKTDRTKKTIEPFLLKFNKKAEYTSLVNEQEMGELTGKSRADYQNALILSELSKEEFKPKGGENYYDLMDRAKIFLNQLKNEKSQNILVVTHAGFIRSVFINLLNLKKETLNFDPASITWIEFDEKFNVLDYNLNLKIV